MMRMQEYFGDNGRCCCIDIEGLLSSQGLLSRELRSHHKSLHLQRSSVFQKMVNFLENISTTVFKIVNVTPTVQQHQQAIALLRECYREMLTLEDKYAGSVFHKSENFDEHRTWQFSSAIFFAMTLFTTIGYGTIACETMAGKVATIIYSVIGIPLMLMVLGDIGRTLFGMMTKFYNSILRTFRKTKRTIAMKIWRCDQLTPDDCFRVLIGSKVGFKPCAFNDHYPRVTSSSGI
uniref:Potassium channel domain-containing protein n=1 Tax=Parascaris univalens TaxID=6257 RepID=A0A915B7S9_PARUN